MSWVHELMKSGRVRVEYPFVCYECGGHTRTGDRCSLCGGRGRRVTKLSPYASPLGPRDP